MDKPLCPHSRTLEYGCFESKKGRQTKFVPAGMMQIVSDNHVYHGKKKGYE